MLVLVTCVCAVRIHTQVFQICLLLISHSGTTAMSVIFLLAHTVFFSSFHFIPNKEFITAYGISRWHCVFNPSCSKEGTEQDNKTAFLTTSLNNEIRTCEWVHRPDHTVIKQNFQSYRGAFWKSVCVSPCLFPFTGFCPDQNDSCPFLWCNAQIQ